MPLAVCATPIGNLDDVTLRVLAELRGAELVLAEDTRHTRKLLDRHAIDARLLSYHEHNEAARVAKLKPRLDAGERNALVSDPGARIVRAARDAGIAVTVLPGPSAVETALVASGLVADRYAFLGFLPRRQGELDRVWAELAASAWPAVAFEAPGRVPATLASLSRAFPSREAAVCRELTKQFEEVVRAPVEELVVRFGEAPRGEITLVIAPARGRPVENGVDAVAVAAVTDLVDAGTPRKIAAEVVSRLTDMSRNDLYRRTL